MASADQIQLYKWLIETLYMSDEEASTLSGIDYDQFDLLDQGEACDVIGALLIAERDSSRN